MPVIEVGPTRTHKTISAGVTAAKAGDTVQVDAGEYVDDIPSDVIRFSLHFIANGCRVVCKMTKPVPNQKGMFIAGPNDSSQPQISFDGFEMTGATNRDKNGAAVRYQSGNLTITNCFFHHNEDGVLATPFVLETGTVTIENSEFAFNGAGDGQSHNIYVNKLERFEIRDSYFHDARVGHEIKSRSLNTTITNTRIFDNQATASYNVDVPNGGNVTIEHCAIQQGPNSQNPNMITYGVEGLNNPGRSVKVANNIIVNDKPNGKLFYNSTQVPIDFVANDVWGLTENNLVYGGGPLNESGTTYLTTRPELDTSPIVPGEPPVEPPDIEEPPVEKPPVEGSAGSSGGSAPPAP